MPSTAAMVSPADQQASKDGQAVVAQAVLSHASTLARAGRLNDAANVLVELDARGDVRVLDLLAKVRAQQGRYGDAESLWSRAKALSGTDTYDASLKRAATFRARPAGLRAGRVIPGVLAVAALATVLVLAPWRTSTPSAGAVSAAPAAMPPAKGSGSVSEKNRAGAPAAGQLGDFSAVGVRQGMRDDGVELTFAEGLFQAGVSLRPDAGAILDALGARLGRVPPKTMVIITGHTDDIPVAVGKRFADNTALGLARATVVMRRLLATSSLPAAAFLVGTAGDGGAPYPNDARDNRLRNRTVTVQLRQGARGQ